MDPLSDTVDVACVCGVPARGGVAEMGLGCEEELKSDVGWRWRVGEEGVWLVVWLAGGSEMLSRLLCGKVSLVLAGYGIVRIAYCVVENCDMLQTLRPAARPCPVRHCPIDHLQSSAEKSDWV